jgi:hypothetical protein
VIFIDILISCIGNDRRVRLWSAHSGYLHAVNYDMSCTSNLPFSMEIISDNSGANDVLVHPSGQVYT